MGAGPEREKGGAVADSAGRVRVSTIVGTDPAESFKVFTCETALWWRRDPRFRISSTVPGILRFEPDGAGSGRVLEEFPGRESVEIGTILVWQPGARLLFEWRSRCFDPSIRTEVEVTFARVKNGTEIMLEHRGWKRDVDSQAFRDWLGLWWGDLFTSYRRHSRRWPESAIS
jgi:Activator of Hsp90 ATPase homolog 1-like protein